MDPTKAIRLAMMVAKGVSSVTDKPLFKKDGGEVDAAQSFLPTHEREANKAKFLEASKIKDRMYHATHSDFNKFRNNFKGVHFLTPDTEFANDFLTNSGQDEHQEGANVMPLHVHAKNPFDYENPKHVNALATKASLGKLAIDQIKEGDWSRIEDRTTLKAIKALGHDSVYVKEGGVKNIGVFDPTQIKSAIGNRGTYDLNESDITKADGGEVDADLKTAKRLGMDTSSIPEIRKAGELSNFHNSLGAQVNERAMEHAQRAQEYHESGKLPMPVGTRFHTEHSRKNGMRPWTVVGHYVDSKDPEKYGYFAERGKPDDEDWSSGVLLASDPKADERFSQRGHPPIDRNFQALGSLSVAKADGGEVDVDNPLAMMGRPQRRMASKMTVGPQPLTLDAYHGTPHLFPPSADNPLGEFDSSKIGTGEGAQAYGHGHYLTEAKKIGEHYAYKLTDVGGGPVVMDDSSLIPRPRYGSVADGIYHRTKHLNDLKEKAAAGDINAKNSIPAMEKSIEDLKKKASVYTVHVPDEHVERMLDWDKPLDQQSDHVKSILQDKFPSAFDDPRQQTGGALYKEQAKKMMQIGATGNKTPEAFISDVLSRYGIPGIKYFDEQSRKTGKGTRNFVIFPGNEKHLKILKREADGGAVYKAGGGSVKTEDAQKTIRRALMVARSAKGVGGSAADDNEISQRLVTSKRSRDDNKGAMLNADLESLKSSGNLYGKVIDAVKRYPNIETKVSRRKNNDSIAEHFIDHATNNLLWLHDAVPEEIRNRSKLWYDGANRIVNHWAGNYGLPNHSVAAALAALSPQKDWYMNVSAGNRVLNINRGYGHEFYEHQPLDQKMEDRFNSRPSMQPYKGVLDMIRGKSLAEVGRMGLDPDESNFAKALWTRLYDEAYHSPSYHIINPEGTQGKLMTTDSGAPAKMAWGSFGEIGKAIAAIEAERHPNLISPLMGQNHKVRNFYNNMLSPNSPHGHVTIDTHAVAAALLRPLSGSDLEVDHNFGGAGGSDITGIRGTYPLYAEAYRRAAAQRGLLPREMQSITWEAVRGLFPDRFKTQKNSQAIDGMWNNFKHGKSDLDTTRKLIHEYAGGIRSPSWAVDRPVENNEATEDTSHARALSEPVLLGGSAQAPDGGAGDGSAPSVSQEPPKLRAFGGSQKAEEDVTPTQESMVRSVDNGGSYDQQDLQSLPPGRPEDGSQEGELQRSGGIRRGDSLFPSPAEASASTPLAGLPQKVTIPKTGEVVAAGPHAGIREIARRYAESAGLDYKPTKLFQKVNSERAARIARAYDEMPHDPSHPLVKSAYDKMIEETLAQYKHAKAHGFKAEFWDPNTQNDPYDASPRKAVEDLRNNHHLYVFPTRNGFGSDAEMAKELAHNPLLADTGERWNGQVVTANDIFRAVHDYYGHAKEGVGFRADGEENAWRAHAAMYTPLARAAMTSETRGQNSWLNYGPHGEHNRNARTEDTIFAPQKTGLMPAWTMHEGAEDFTPEKTRKQLHKIMGEPEKATGAIVDRALHLVSHLSRR